MARFNRYLFDTLFHNLHLFSEIVQEGIPREESEGILDNNDNDITACLDLSIFPELKNITHWGENMDVKTFPSFGLKKGMVAGGIIISGMDWCDSADPHYFYEFARFKKKKEVKEYVTEKHFDDIVMQVFAQLDQKPGASEKGSEEGLRLVLKVIGNDTAPHYNKQDFKYRCLVEGKDFEIWKIGFHQGAYQVFITAPDFISNVNEEGILFTYLWGEAITKMAAFPRMEEKDLAKIKLNSDDPYWYNKGMVDLDPYLTIKKEEEAKAKLQQDLADKIYQNILDGKLNEIDITVLPKVVTLYTPLQLALIKVANAGAGEPEQQFGKTLLEACRQYCPNVLKDADKLILRTTEI